MATGCSTLPVAVIKASDIILAGVL